MTFTMKQSAETRAHERAGRIRCGAYLHAFYDIDDDWLPYIGNPLVLRCERCGTVRRDALDDNGALVSRRYIWPPGYKYGPGLRPSRSEFRVLLLQQRIKEAAAARRAAR